MPLYEYECTACHRRLEKIQKFSDPELTKCPHCGGKLERTVTAPSFQFAGGGWYKDLYSSKPGGTADSKPESKPASDSTPASATSAPAAAAPSAPASPAPSSSSTTSKT